MLYTSKPPNFGVLSMWQILPWSPIFGSWGMFPPWPSNFWRLGLVLYYTHAQPRYSKFWSLGHAVYCIHAQPKTSKLWSLEHVVYTLHMPNPGPPQILEFGECCIFYNPGHQNFGFWSMLYILHMPLPSLAPTHAQFGPPKIGAWSYLKILNNLGLNYQCFFLLF